MSSEYGISRSLRVCFYIASCEFVFVCEFGSFKSQASIVFWSSEFGTFASHASLVLVIHASLVLVLCEFGFKIVRISFTLIFASFIL